MPSATPLKTNCQLHQGLAGCAIQFCLDDCKPAYLDMAIERGLMPNLDRTWQNDTSHIAHSVIPLSEKPNPNKFEMDRGGFSRNEIDMAFSSGGAAPLPLLNLGRTQSRLAQDD